MTCPDHIILGSWMGVSSLVVVPSGSGSHSSPSRCLKLFALFVVLALFLL